MRWTRLLMHMAGGFLTLRFLWPRADTARRHEIAVRWARDLLAILGIRVHCEGRPPPRGRHGAMIAANHVSWADIFAIASVRHTRFIAKSEIRDWPLAGWLAERSGTIFIRRARRHDTARINALVHDALAQGECVGLFPEGTTTEGDRLLKFHSSLFEPAVANQARVYPAAVRYEHPDGTPLKAAAYVGDLSFAQSLGLVIRTRETVVRVAFAEPVDPAGLTRQEVAAEAQRRVATLLGLPNPGRALPRGGDRPA
ncbi:MAG: 1-acyl-sn-glycerol-3-phosphate acyltransferase [Burkholderiales bacterium]|nr:1-acyl-sn-glycerol-3-phosphate acyltransferase [Burkholderiales bacterium]